MDISSREKLEQIFEQVELKEARIRRNAVWYTIIPLITGIIFLGYTSFRVYKESKEIEMLSSRASQYETVISSLEDSIANVQKLLSESTDMAKYIYELDPVTIKQISSIQPREAEIINLIIELRRRGVKWQLGGFKPETGFDSPSFALYVLKELGLVSGIENNLDARYKLLEILPQGNRQPEIGNLVFYPSGYVMFYFMGLRNRPFVIGMSPMGIVSLKPGFARIIGIRRFR